MWRTGEKKDERSDDEDDYEDEEMKRNEEKAREKERALMAKHSNGVPVNGTPIGTANGYFGKENQALTSNAPTNMNGDVKKRK